ncbi:MAG TPA: SRPBCC family protein [Acidimicrobiia bacterium]|nr:SRPBCC family protein [Acidimicrobiia bacterium]
MQDLTMPARIDAEQYTVTRSVFIAASRERVWEAITVPEEIAKWFGQPARFNSLTVGADGSFGWEGYGEFPVRIEEVDEPAVFAFTWGTPGEPITPQNSTTARFTLEEVDGGTLLTVVESGFADLADPADSMEDNRGGWDSELDELVAYLTESA